MTVAELGERMSSRELSEWMAYYEVEPFGDERGDLRSGVIAATIANVNRDPKQRKKPYTPLDFMPFAEKKETDLLAKFDAIVGGGG